MTKLKLTGLFFVSICFVVLGLLKSLAVTEALELVAFCLTTGFLLWPEFQTFNFTNIHISARGTRPKLLHTHAQTKTLQIGLVKQASKLCARAPWSAARHCSLQNSWHSQHVQSMYCELWEARQSVIVVTVSSQKAE